MPQLQQEQWNASYERGDNQMLYPKEEVVKFLNRFVRKRTGPNSFRDLLAPRPGAQELRGLDYGCGVGRMTVLLEEFGIRAWGVDISPTCLAAAREVAAHFGHPSLADRFAQVDGLALPFDDGFFDVGIASGVLDSMHFEFARRVALELDRVVERWLYVDLISGDNGRFHREFDGEEVVSDAVERGTVQSYFNWTKVQTLFAPTRFRIHWARLITEQSCTDRFRYSRYHVVLRK
ncbi:MAG: class I SAM-dependent methyltransferase [Phycisphaerales bacterium]|nr:class I SAM-dependent methyltransferase [Phycisphaerales bacterium]